MQAFLTVSTPDKCTDRQSNHSTLAVHACRDRVSYRIFHWGWKLLWGGKLKHVKQMTCETYLLWGYTSPIADTSLLAGIRTDTILVSVEA